MTSQKGARMMMVMTAAIVRMSANRTLKIIMNTLVIVLVCGCVE
jgi:hypothetical protein